MKSSAAPRDRRVKVTVVKARGARPESLLVSMEFTIAGQLHRCGYNLEHSVEPGMARLTIRDKGKEHHYCLKCARTLLAESADHLQLLRTGVEQFSRL